jgi:hypothetical protein
MKIIRYLLVFLISCAIGLLIGGGVAVLFTDLTWGQLLDKFAQIDFVDLLILIAEAILSTIVAVVLSIVVHEGGHLIFGLLTGYRFVSFRVFSLTLIKTDGRYRLKRFALGGTGGQCLMRPPLCAVTDINSRWYNAGGVLMNLLTACIAFVLYYYTPTDGSRFTEALELFCLIMFIINIIIVLTNGIPLRMGGIGNDGYNLLHLERRPADKQLLYRLLEANALVQSGTQPKELPTEWFPQPSTVAPTDWSDGLQANWQMIAVAHFESQHDWDAAYQLLSDAMAHRQQLLGLFEKELTTEMVFVCLATGRIDEARTYWNDDLMTYVSQYAKTQSSKQRILAATTLLLEDDPAGARQLLATLRERKNDYLLQGEAAMDLELMEWLLMQSNEISMSD